MPVEPEIIGVRHHSPACARWVARRIRERRPAHVLIEGPADFNPRIDELLLEHRLPIALYSYLSDSTRHRASWTPFARHSPEWQALLVGREVGAALRFIDLPAWHDAMCDVENRYADAADASEALKADAYDDALATRLGIDGRDALWDHLFEGDGEDLPADYGERLSTYFDNLRGSDPGSVSNGERETMMAQWIGWAMAQKAGPVLVVCGGYHAPALARLWPRDADAAAVPATASPTAADADQASTLRHGTYLMPFTDKRLDAFAGYASGLSSPGWYQWCWEHGLEQAGVELMRRLRSRLRERKHPISTADLIALHARANALSHLRGHAKPLRCDWLDAVAGALVKDALEVPLPWSERGRLAAGTDPVLVEVMDVLTGEGRGQLAAETPQPPLLGHVASVLQAHGITLQGSLRLDLFDTAERSRSQILHRLLGLQIPGIERRSGATLALSGEREEVWALSQPLEQHAALIEAAAWGGTLQDAARARLEARLTEASGDVLALSRVLDAAAWMGIADIAGRTLQSLQSGIAAESRFESLGAALAVLHPLLVRGDWLGMTGAPILQTAVDAAFERALWLFEPPALVPTADADAHVNALIALRDVARDWQAQQSDDARVSRLRAVCTRKAVQPDADPLSRGGALGLLHALDPDQTQPGTDALALLAGLPPACMGDALSGVLALAREVVMTQPAVLAGIDQAIRAMDETDFLLALPALRLAFAWLPPRERGALAADVLRLHGDTAGTTQLTARLDEDPMLLATRSRREQLQASLLDQWGVSVRDEATP